MGNGLIHACFSGFLVDSFLGEDKVVSGSGRIPLWIVATVAGLGIITVVGIFFYGAYAGIGSSI
jgi:photosystem II PsbJ protein